MTNPAVMLVHAVATYPMNADTLRRHRVARASWESEYARTGQWIEAWLDEKDLKRTSKDVGDPRGTPFVKDLVNHALYQCRNDDDAIVLTNTDSAFVCGVTERLLAPPNDSPRPVYSHRHDFMKLDRMLSHNEVFRGRIYPGWDLFKFGCSWWNAHKDEMPDAITGSSGWDACLQLLCKKYGGREMGCTVVHERHAPFWARPENRQKHPGQLWNAKVNRPFLLKHGWTQAQCERYA